MPKNSSRLIFYIFVFLYLCVSSWSLFQLRSHLELYAQYKLKNAELMGFEGRLLDYKEWLPELFSTQSGIQSTQLLENAAKSMDSAIVYSLVLLMAFLLITMIIGVTGIEHKRYWLANFTLIGALVFLIAGVTTPVLELSAVKNGMEIPLKIDSQWIGSYDFSRTFGGEMYFYLQIKSIIGVIVQLFQKKNVIIAMAILLFSIVLPIIKIFLSYKLLMHDNIRLRRWLSVLAKWSMADVFLASLFLAFLSFNQMSTGVDMVSNTLPGIYLFLFYCLLSIIVGFILPREQD